MDWMQGSQDDFRDRIRLWLDENCPQEMRDGDTGEAAICWGGRNWSFQSQAQKQWLQNAVLAGITTPTWPKAYGGGGLDRAREKILAEEMGRIQARPPLQSFGIWMLGPALLKFGTEEQKQKYLTSINQ